MIRLTKYLFGFGITVLFLFSCSNTFEKKVESSVREQLNSFPKSRLQDIYKNFFQDRYGPETLVTDTFVAGVSLRKECDTCSHAYMKMVEDIGWQKNYCRISTHALKLEYIPYDIYFNSMIESSNKTLQISIEKWKDEWASIVAVLDKMNLNIPDYESDKVKITNMLKYGEYILPHSDEFTKTYHPHYRVIRKDLFLKKIKPYLMDD